MAGLFGENGLGSWTGRLVSFVVKINHQDHQADLLHSVISGGPLRSQ